jgi:DNA-directed RNA polymerase subunit RPC12/RpoP
MESEAERENSAPPLPQPHQAENASYFHQFNTTGASHTPQQKSPHDSLYQCQTCHHTFERADRLTRHLKSHENARQYRCQRCQKSFNRADLLNRHMITHNRQSNSRNNTIRIDRANRACSACAAAKVRCEDRKPCRRCWTKNISCDIATQTGQKKSISATNENLIDLSTSQLLTPPSTAVAQYIKTTDQPDLKSIFSDQASVYATEVQVQNTDDDEIISSSSIDTTMPSISNYDMGILQPEVVQVVFDNIMNEMLFFPNVAGFNTQSLEDNHLDFRFPDGLSEINSPLPMPMNEAGGAENGCQSKRDINAGYAAFKRSPWHYTPTAKDGILRDQENLTLNEGIICLDHSQILRSSRLTPDIPSCGFPTITAGQRDKMFHLLASMNKPLESVPGFPSLSILNHVMEAFFIEQNYQVGSWIHVPTISSPKNAIIPELLTAFVIAGSTLIPVPEIHKMGLVLQDVVRLKIAELVGLTSSSTKPC